MSIGNSNSSTPFPFPWLGLVSPKKLGLCVYAGQLSLCILDLRPRLCEIAWRAPSRNACFKKAFFTRFKQCRLSLSCGFGQSCSMFLLPFGPKISFPCASLSSQKEFPKKSVSSIQYGLPFFEGRSSRSSRRGGDHHCSHPSCPSLQHERTECRCPQTVVTSLI